MHGIIFHAFFMKIEKLKKIAPLFIYQGINALFPVFLFPIVLHKIGPTEFAKIVSSESIVIFVLTCVIYGFDIRGVSLIIKNSCSYWRSSYYFSIIFYSRCIVFFISLLIITPIVFYYKREILWEFIIWTFWPLSYIFLNFYYYHAKKNVDKLIYFYCIPRILCFLFLLFIMDESSTSIFIVFSIVLCYFSSGVLGFFYLRKSISLVYVEFFTCLRFLKREFYIFWGNISVFFYRGTNLIFFNFFPLSAQEVSSYAIVEKTIKALQASVLPISQFFTPNMISEVFKSDEKRKIIIRYSLKSFSVGLAVALVSVVPLVMLWRFWGLSPDYMFFYIIMISAVPASSFNYMAGSIGLNSIGYSKQFALILSFVGCFGAVIGFLGIFFKGGLGASIAYGLSEVLLLIFIVISLKKVSFK